MTEDSHEFTQLIDDIEKLTENIKASFESTIEGVSSFLSWLDEAVYSSGKWWLDQIEANIVEKERYLIWMVVNIALLMTLLDLTFL